jgi:cystathionine gamma-synthase
MSWIFALSREWQSKWDRVLVTKADNDEWRNLQQARKLAGNIMSPFDAWLLIRGMRTLCLRFRHSSQSALRIAEYLSEHSKIDRVLYPGLATHPNHTVAREQMTDGFGAMLSILVKGAEREALAIASSTRLFSPATSLGGVESLIEHRRSVEGPNSIVAPNLLRLSIGLEAIEDLIGDLDDALSRLA